MQSSNEDKFESSQVIDLENLDLLFNPSIERKEKITRVFNIAKFVTKHPQQILLYGGFVRDLLLHKDNPPADYDFVGDFDLDQIEDDYFDNVQGRWDEVSTIRLKFGEEIYDFTAAKNIEERLKENDITISNICIDEEGCIIDFFDGISSLRNSEIKVLDVDRKMALDPSRILRVFRFAVELGFKIDPDTLRGIEENAHLLQDSENVLDELYDLYFLKDEGHRNQVLALLEKHGILSSLFTERAREKVTNVYVLEKFLRKYPQLLELREMFPEGLVLVGGALREIVWGKRINDLDFKVLLPIEEIVQVLEKHGFEKCCNYRVKDGQYYLSDYPGVLGFVINGMDIHFSVTETLDLPKLIAQGDLSLNCLAYDLGSQKILNPEQMQVVEGKILSFCDNKRAQRDPDIIINALKQISRCPEITVSEEVLKIIKQSLSSVVQYISGNPQLRYRVDALCGNINSESVYDLVGENSSLEPFFEKLLGKKDKVYTTHEKYRSYNINEADSQVKLKITDFLRRTYGDYYDDAKNFPENVNSVVLGLSGEELESCCLLDGERLYAVAAAEQKAWIDIVKDLIWSNYNIWGTVNYLNPKVQSLCLLAGFKLENDTKVIETILRNKTKNCGKISFQKYNGHIVFYKEGTDNYPQVLFRA